MFSAFESIRLKDAPVYRYDAKRSKTRIYSSGATRLYSCTVAEASNAEFLVTGDEEVLSLEHPQSTRMVTAATTVDVLRLRGATLEHPQ